MKSDDYPVTVTIMWQATCDVCGWHTPPTSPKHVVHDWAEIHRESCDWRRTKDGAP